MNRLPQDLSYSQLETLESQGMLGLDETPSWPCLTILYHPDLRRIGEQAILGQLAAGRPIELSRNAPEFVSPKTLEAGPLRDPFLSRSPVHLQQISDGALSIIPSPEVHLCIDDERVESAFEMPVAALQRGIVLQLSRRVLLLFHVISIAERAPRWGLVGESEGICQVRRQIAQVADLDFTVLIRGETGVGKERVAQAIHAASKRADQPCIAVNMATLSPGTAPSELFGHAKGAFTGAVERSIGLFERADHGTLFLDEIGETPSNVQAMLLRALGERTIMPLGGTKERKVDVRIIAATDANIEQSAETGTFRAALLHRLTGYEIRVPPLRERREDIPRLTVHFLEHALTEIHETWRLMPRTMSKTLWFPPKLMLQLYRFDWPGNVRQLCNVVQQLVISSRGMAELRMDERVSKILSEAPAPKSHLFASTGEGRSRRRGASSVGRETRSLTDGDIYQALVDAQWNIGRAAEILDIPRSTLYKHIERHPEIRKAKDIGREELEACMRACKGDVERMAETLRVSPHGLRLRMRELGLKYEDPP